MLIKIFGSESLRQDALVAVKVDNVKFVYIAKGCS
jgi:hypothetical protein